LRNEIYGITQGNFNIWGLGGAMNQESAPYFHGTYMNALMAVFPDLNLDPLGFQLDWSNEERGIESVKYVLTKEVPQIMQQYERIAQLNDREIHDLRNDIYGISSGHFKVWGLGGAMDQRLAPYFHGSHITALLTVFSDPKLGLTREGFIERAENGSSGASLMTEDTRREAVKRGMNPNSWSSQLFFAPHYEFLDTFNPIKFFLAHREQTVGQVIGILLIWGAMVAAMIGAPFGIDFVLSGSPTAHLGYDLIGSLAGSISILAGIRLNQLASYKPNRTEKIIFSIAYLTYPINVLIHHLFNLISNLTRPLGKWRLAPLTKARVGEDQYDWATREQGIENVRDGIKKNRPDLLERYESLDQLPPKEREQEEESLREELYRITLGHFQIWGLSGAMNRKVAPYFHGSYMDALMAVFPDLNLNPLGFQLDWSNEERGIESVRYVLSKEVPHIMQQYERIAELSDREIHNLRNEIYGITSGHFKVWGLSRAMNQESAPYFHGSHMNALLVVFSHPTLGLTREGFVERAENRGSGAGQVTEDTSNEAENNSSLDILEPLVQPQSRFKTWQTRVAYYLFVGSWEESFYRWGALILLPASLTALGLDSTLSSFIGFSISAFGFLFSHTIVRWLVSRNSDKWKGWKIEVKNDLLSSKLISTLLLNTIFITVLIFYPISPSLVLFLTIPTHTLFDFSKAQAKDRVGEKSFNQEIREVAHALNEPEEGLNHLFFENRVTLNSILNSIFSLWTKESKSPELYIIDLNSSKDLENRLALFRTIQQIKYYKKSNPTEKIKCVIVKKNGQSIEELEKILGLKDILFIANSPEETVEKLKELVKQQSFSIRIVTVPQNSKAWLDILVQNFKFIELKMMVFQLLDVGREIRISLSQLGTSKTEMNEWIEKLIQDGEAEIEGEEAVIKAVPFEPPSKEEELKIGQLFNQQA
ncbi:MAG: hypothetical protein HYT97_02865, partial [Elusimicrobia bacterium]|nr:hypothetical protein [Elusimicrobiota bacterium]